MGWFRDGLKALVWAVAAAGASIALASSGLVGGLLPNLLPLLVAPPLAFRWHHSGRVAGLVGLWVLVLGG